MGLSQVPLYTVQAQPTIADQQLNLEGAGRFTIVVDVEAPESLTGEFERVGFKSVVADRLAGHGIEVDEAETRFEGEPYLYVHINAMQFEGGLVPFSVDLRFYEQALVGPDKRILAMAAIWDSGAVGLVSIDQLRYVRASLESLVDEFAGDYLVANP